MVSKSSLSFCNNMKIGVTLRILKMQMPVHSLKMDSHRGYMPTNKED